jgi:hypothetical protein
MPGIITHLAFAEKYLKKNPIKDFDKFVLGSVFPDVRYFAKIDRKITHEKFMPDTNVAQLNVFDAGWKLHLYLDERWSELMKNNVFFERYKDEPFIVSAAAKILEDELDYKRLKKPEKYQEIFRNQQLGSILRIPAEKMRLFYTASVDYLETRDFKVLARYFLDEELIGKILGKIEEMKYDKALVDFLSVALNRI